LNKINLIDKSGYFSAADKDFFSFCAAIAVDVLNRQNENMSVLLSDDPELQNLNKQFTGNDYPTDVLSFTANQFDPETGRNYLGDIVISADRAFSQAQAQNNTALEEISTLIVHGILHLCGYDHADPISHDEMFSKQAEILLAIREKMS